MLFYSVVVIALAATSLATPPPGYVKKPDNDKDPPAYEYKYEIGDGNGKGQGKAETRAGEFASGSYYVNTGQATTDVKYFVDDWGYHPVVKYGSTDKHSSTTTHFALGEEAVKALRTGGDVGPKVKIPAVESSKRKPVQIIQPYTIGNNDPSTVTPTYSTIGSDGRDASNVDKTVQQQQQGSREYPISEEENFPKESRGPSTILIPPSSHSTTPQEIAYTASTAAPKPPAYAPLQGVRDIYAKNDYQNAALIDEQLYLQSAAGNFGQKVHASSVGESGIKDFKFSTVTTSPSVNSPAYSLTKQNGDVTYTVHSGSNSNTAYLSAAVKNKKTQRVHNRHQYRQKFTSSSTTTEVPNYSSNGLNAVIFASTTLAPATPSREFTSNDLVGEKQEKYEYVSLGAKPSREFTEFGPADPGLVNYGLRPGNEGPNRHQEELETQGLLAYGTGNSLQNENEVKTSSVFAKPIVVAEVTPGDVQLEFVAPTTPAPVFSTTSQPIISTERIVVTPKYESQSQITTSAVVLNPIQAGVALLNSGETHLISQVATNYSTLEKGYDASESSALTIGQSESHEQSRLRLEDRIRQILEHQREHENRIQQEKQQNRVKQLQEEIQLQQIQQLEQERQLQQNQYEIQELQLKQQLELEEFQRRQRLGEREENKLREEEKFNDQQLGEDTQLQQEVELQQVEESQQNEQQESIVQIDELQLDENQGVNLELEEHKEINAEQVRQEEELRLQQEYEAHRIQEEIAIQTAQQLQQQQQQLQFELQQQLDEYQQKQQRNKLSNSFVESSKSAHDSGIEIQKSIEIYHNEPVHEIHYPAQVSAHQVESSEIDQSLGQQQYIELQSTENTQQGYRGQVQSGGTVSLEINHVPGEQAHQLGQKDQFSLGAEAEAQQVLVAENQPNLNQPFDLTPSNSLSQQSSTSNGALLLGFRVNHEFGGRQNYQIDQHREAHKIDLQPNPHPLIFGSGNANGAYQLNQRDQSHSHSHSHSHSYESNRGQQQVAVGLPTLHPYTLEASKELVLPGIQATSTQIIETPLFKNHVSVPNAGDNYALESSNESALGRIVEKHIPVLQPYPVEKIVEQTVHVPQPYPVEKHIPVLQPYPVEKIVEKTVHVPQPYPVEKIIEKKVPYPVDRIVEKHVPILQPYPVHIKVPQPYPVEKIVEKPFPVETIVEKPVHIHVPVEKIVEKKVPVPQPYPVEKIVEKTVHVPQPYPVEKIVERIVEKHIRVPYAVEVVRKLPYGVHYGVSYQQIMRPHSHSLYCNNHGKTHAPFYGLPIVTRHQEFRHQDNSHVDSKLQFSGYGYDKSAVSFGEGGNSNDQITAGGQQIQYKHVVKSNAHGGYPHYSPRRYGLRTGGKEKQRIEEYIGPVPPQRSPLLRHHQHSLQNQHAAQARSPQSSTAATRSPTATTTLRRAREPEAKPQSSAGNFRQSRVEYGFKPPMIPSVQYDEKTASKVES